MSNSLDDILSGGGEAMPESPEVNVAEVATEAVGEIQPEQASAESGGQTEASAESEREKRRGSGAQLDAAEERHRQELERARKEAKDEARRMFAAEAPRIKETAVQEYLQQQKQQQPDDAVDRVFSDPRALIREEMAAAEKAREFERNQRDWEQQRYYAELHFGAEKVAKAETAFEEAYKSGQIGEADIRTIATSPNRAAAAIQWLERQTVLAEIGNDPAAYRAKIAAEEREKILAEQGGQQQVQQRPAVMPSNFTTTRNVGARNGSVWSGPSSINEIFDLTRPSG